MIEPHKRLTLFLPVHFVRQRLARTMAAERTDRRVAASSPPERGADRPGHEAVGPRSNKDFR